MPSCSCSGSGSGNPVALPQPRPGLRCRIGTRSRLFAPAPRPVVAAAAPRKAPPMRNAASRANGKSTAVVNRRLRFAAAGRAGGTRLHAFLALRAYAPVSARFNSPKGVVYRLSVKGFASANEACRCAPRSSGPVELASCARSPVIRRCRWRRARRQRPQPSPGRPFG
jgi:hypothetical protein